MGQKVNYNKKRTNKIKIVLIIIVCVLAILVLIKSIKDVKDSLKAQENANIADTAHALVKDYKSLESLLATCDCKVISKSEDNNKMTVTLNFGKNLYDGNTSNENYFWNIVGLVANYIDYKDFELIDKSKNIDIEVDCEKPYITSFVINGDENYYLKHNSDINASKDKEITSNISIQAQILKDLIDNNWQETKMNFGTKESQFMDYDIYFDEGLKVKIVAQKIFNVVFTNKYVGNVAGGLSTNATFGEVEAALGKSTYGDGMNYCGYKAEKYYIFFDFMNNQISVYPVMEISKSEEEEFSILIQTMNETQDIKKFVTDLTAMWIDYDVYEFKSNYVDLKYSLKGVEVCIYNQSLNNGIFIYQNYSGDKKIDSNDKVYMKSTNMVVNEEYSRIMYESEKAYGALLQKNPESDSYYVELINDSEHDIIKGRFISKDGSKPDIEINEGIYTLAWMTDVEIIYSIQNKGIYYYNLETGAKQELISGSEDYNIISFENGILSYDETTLTVSR